jgi:hypothetical protein
MKRSALCLVIIMILAIAPTQVFSLDVSLGYVGDGGGTIFTDDAETLVAADFEYAPVQAFYLEFRLPVSLSSYCELQLTGGITVPVTVKVEELFPQSVFVPGNQRHNADWDADTTWGILEGLLSFPLDSGFSVVCGFRWDHWQSSLKNPRNISLFSSHNSTDTAALTVNGYLPLIGIVSSVGGFSFGAMGFPVALGDVEVTASQNRFGTLVFRESGHFDSGYFLEIFTELNLPNPGFALAGTDGSVSLFAKLSFYEATDNITFSVSGSFSQTDNTDFAFRRTLFVAGGKASINFSLPSLDNVL